MVRSTRVELVVGVAARQLLMLARLPFRHDRMGLVALTKDLNLASLLQGQLSYR
jgi:hypothetical protein